MNGLQFLPKCFIPYVNLEFVHDFHTDHLAIKHKHMHIYNLYT
jgi:hypothetical protein